MRHFFLIFAVCFITLTVTSQNSKPNFIIIFADDLGYADISCFESKIAKTPHLDQMAKEGMKLTSFMVPSPVCTPSRAGLLTGCYPKTVGLHDGVLSPKSKEGLHPKEYTIADYLKEAGYQTACIGKWHLGHHKEVLPQQQGFDYYYGIPYSNDMAHASKKVKKTKELLDEHWMNQADNYAKWGTPLMEGNKIIEHPVDQRTITRRYTDKAISFIKAHKKDPFFVYLPHSMPHKPLFVPDDVHDKNPKNAYKNVIEHLDTEIGRVIKTVKDLGLQDHTYIIFTSDNGPSVNHENHGGSPGILRGNKGNTFEGGQRVPCIVWSPGNIPANVTSNALCTSMDILPTITSMTKQKLHNDFPIDGKNIYSIITNKSEKTPHDYFLYYTTNGNIEGIRQGKWKLKYLYSKSKKTKEPKKELLLFNLENDVRELNNVAASNTNIVKKLEALMAEADKEITKNARPVWTKQ